MRRSATALVPGFTVLALFSCAACGGAAGRVSEPAPAAPEEAGAVASEMAPDAGSSASPSATAATASPRTPPDAGTASASTPVPERPFASTPEQARSLIDEQIRARMEGLWQCVANRIAAGSGSHRKVVLEFGIDQDGRLIGATAVGAKSHPLDPAAKACVADALRDAQFPRSKSPITTVRETFTASATSGGS
jgi:hypothetical protein